MTRFGLETRTTVVPPPKRAKCGGRSTGRWQEEQVDLSPALRPDGAPRCNDPPLVPHSQLLGGVFHLHMVISLLTPHRPDTSKWIRPIVDADTHLVDLQVSYASSSWWSVVSDPADHLPHILAWLSKCFVTEPFERFAVVILAHFATFGKPHTSEIQ